VWKNVTYSFPVASLAATPRMLYMPLGSGMFFTHRCPSSMSNTSISGLRFWNPCTFFGALTRYRYRLMPAGLAVHTFTCDVPAAPSAVTAVTSIE
jgi:hypothetical protein